MKDYIIEMKDRIQDSNFYFDLCKEDFYKIKGKLERLRGMRHDKKL